MAKKSVLIVDDERNTREVLARYLRSRFEVFPAEDGVQAIELLKTRDFDLVLTDLRMPGAGGMSVLEATLSKARYTPCVVFTAYGSIENAVKAVKAGAADFVTKPVKLETLDEVIGKVLSEAEKKTAAGRSGDGRELENAAKRAGGGSAGSVRMLGDSPAIRELENQIRKVAPGRVTVLITGESGTGKEVAARMIHDLSGRTGLYVPVHCAALPGNLLESELFGHERGAFTGAVEMRKGRFELADKGTLMLDEIGEIDGNIQVKLLRALESRTIERVGGAEPIVCDARLVAATNRDLESMVSEGTFREDLYYRLNVVRLHLPALRERREDIPILAGHFLSVAAAENQRNVNAISPEAMELLVNYSWPGNIRELKNCVERMVVFAEGDVLGADDVPEEIRNFAGSAVLNGKTLPGGGADGGTLDEMEKNRILRTLNDCGGNRTRAAERLGISRRTLLRRLKDYGTPAKNGNSGV